LDHRVHNNVAYYRYAISVTVYVLPKRKFPAVKYNERHSRWAWTSVTKKKARNIASFCSIVIAQETTRTRRDRPLTQLMSFRSQRPTKALLSGRKYRYLSHNFADVRCVLSHQRRRVVRRLIPILATVEATSVYIAAAAAAAAAAVISDVAGACRCNATELKRRCR